MMKDIEYDSGIYLLEIYLENKSEISVGKMGKYIFPTGYYYYIGSAQLRLHSRLKRHIRKDKKLRWHIDFLIDKARLVDFFTWNAGRDKECMLSSFLEEYLQGDIIVPGFGSSDCSCISHLYYFSSPLDKALLPEKIESRSDLNVDK